MMILALTSVAKAEVKIDTKIHIYNATYIGVVRRVFLL